MRVSRRQVLRTIAASGLLAGAGYGSYGYAYERHRVAVSRLTLPVHGLPAGLAGLRIGLLTDIHYGEFLPMDDLVAALCLLQAEAPDLVLLGGDYVSFSNKAAVAPCADALTTLRAPVGVFAVAGNHDPEATVNSAFESRGIQVLRDEHAHLTVRGEAIALGGVRYWTTKVGDVARVFQRTTGFPILLAHDPRRLAQAAQLGLPLVLSGHTHGGQVVLPLVGALAKARFPVLAGVGVRGKSTVFVSRGLGTVVVPVRVNCPPEVVSLTLRPAG